LVVLPCSGRKRPGGTTTRGGSILDLLDPSLRTRLVNAQGRIAGPAGLDETSLLPAWRRYAGTLYGAAHDALAAATSSEVPIVILSGGYGLVLATDPIGLYDRQFAVRDWPRDLLEECLIAVAQHLDLDVVVAFCARTTAYSKLIRNTPWRERLVDAYIAAPGVEERGGAQVLVPRAGGQAFAAFLNGTLRDSWSSTDGVPIAWERA
jgi:hypothetical protein